jgi:hypothetical protein
MSAGGKVHGGNVRQGKSPRGTSCGGNVLGGKVLKSLQILVLERKSVFEVCGGSNTRTSQILDTVSEVSLFVIGAFTSPNFPEYFQIHMEFVQQL